ncbi:hypothetical protein [Streptomyces sp. CA-106110]
MGESLNSSRLREDNRVATAWLIPLAALVTIARRRGQDPEEGRS